MESATTVATVVTGLFFSLVCALLMEELIFGGMFRFFFAPRVTHISQKKADMGRQ